MTRQAGAVLGMLLLAHAAGAEFTQQVGKLVGTTTSGNPPLQGASVAISADGNTAIVGGPRDNDIVGAAWVFRRSQGVWSQQGNKLVGSDAVPAGAGQGSTQGQSVAISADGNTAIVGGHGDNAFTGAAWVFTRSGGVWSQQGSKLVGTDALGSGRLGYSVAISADGNTAIVGGPGDGEVGGAAWVYTRSGGVWSQQGSMLLASDAAVFASQGYSVGISADGNTVIVGGPNDNGSFGAAWVYTRNGGVWSQQGSKLVGTGAVGDAQQGWSVAIAADGNTAVVGGRYDNNRAGATWVFTRRGAVWSQQGSKLVGTGAVGGAYQGYSVAISADGTTAIVGGPVDNDYAGAAWVFFSPSASTYSAWVPVAAHNPGLNESQWRSDLGLLNTGSGTANAQIRFFGSGGIVSNTTYVPPGTQSILTDVVEQVGAGGQGALEVVSDQPLRVTSRTYNRVSSGAGCYPNGTQGQDYPTLTASDGLSAGQSAYLAGLTENASYRCNIGLVNVSLAPATVLVELYDGAGTKLTDYTVDLAGGQWLQETQPFRNRAGQTAMDRGYARVTVTLGTGVVAFASLVDNVTNDPTTVNMQH